MSDLGRLSEIRRDLLDLVRPLRASNASQNAAKIVLEAARSRAPQADGRAGEQTVD